MVSCKLQLWPATSHPAWGFCVNSALVFSPPESARLRRFKSRSARLTYTGASSSICVVKFEVCCCFGMFGALANTVMPHVPLALIYCLCESLLPATQAPLSLPPTPAAADCSWYHHSQACIEAIGVQWQAANLVWPACQSSAHAGRLRVCLVVVELSSNDQTRSCFLARFALGRFNNKHGSCLGCTRRQATSKRHQHCFMQTQAESASPRLTDLL